MQRVGFVIRFYATIIEKTNKKLTYEKKYTYSACGIGLRVCRSE